MPATGLTVSLSNAGAGGRLTFQGRAEKLDSDPKLAGLIEIDATDSGPVLALVPGIGRFAGQLGALKGRTQLTLARRTLGLDDIHLSRAGGDVSGALKFDLAAPKADAKAQPQAVSGQLAFDRLSIADLLALVADTSRAQMASAISVTTGRAGVWPDHPFNFDVGTLVSGSVSLSARALTIADDLTLRNAKATLALAANSMTISDVSGQGFGGTWTASAKLDRVPAGAQLTATVALTQGALDVAGGAGPVSGTLQLDGRGLSPSGLVSTLGGSGSVTLGASRITQISAPKLKLAMEKALNAEPDKLGMVLKSELDGPSAVEPVAIGPRKVPVEIKDGVLRIAPFQAESAEGKVTPQARLDLSTFLIDGEWRVESKVQPAPVSAVPNLAGLPAPAKAAKALPPLPGVIVSGTHAAGGARCDAGPARGQYHHRNAGARVGGAEGRARS